MASLNQLATQALNDLNQPFNTMLFERIKDYIKQERATYLTQELRRNLNTGNYIQKYVFALQKVDKADTCAYNIGCSVLRSVNPIATPIVVKSGAPFFSTGDRSGSVTAIYTKIELIPYVNYNEQIANAIRYDYINNYLYFFNIDSWKWASASAAYENPTLVSDECNGDSICYSDNMEFPLPLNMSNSIITNLVAKHLNIKYEDKEIPVNDND